MIASAYKAGFEKRALDFAELISKIPPSVWNTPLYPQGGPGRILRNPVAAPITGSLLGSALLGIPGFLFGGPRLGAAGTLAGLLGGGIGGYAGSGILNDILQQSEIKDLGRHEAFQKYRKLYPELRGMEEQLSSAGQHYAPTMSSIAARENPTSALQEYEAIQAQYDDAIRNGMLQKPEAATPPQPEQRRRTPGKPAIRLPSVAKHPMKGYTPGKAPGTYVPTEDWKKTLGKSYGSMLSFS